tara:strand:- start:51 stop:656 length:606 start_codon:yes stop_codon:yes gene_type:complete
LKQEITFEKNGFIGIFDNVFEDEYIDELINFFEAKDKMNFVQNSSANGNLKIDRDMDEMFLDDIATIQRVPLGYIQHFFQKLWNNLYPLYVEEFSVLKTMQMQGESLKMKRIKPGGGFHSWHFEGMGKTPQRKVVVQLYMNDVDEAGETEFLYQNKRISPKRNRLLIWPADWTHTHRGNPPIGEKSKYILTTWLEETPKGN